MSKIYNLGICDIPNCKEYPGWNTWKGMIKRVALKEGQYKNVTIDPEWLKFSTFNSWYIANKIPFWEMDKDLMSDGRHDHYGPDVCVYLPKEINQALQRHKGYKYKDGSYIPSYSHGGRVIEGPKMIDEKSARSWYIQKKKEYLEELIDSYKVFLREDVIKALKDYKY